MASQDPTSWSRQLLWVEYSINSLPSSSSGLSPFHVCLGYQPPLFATQEAEVGVPSAQAFIKRAWQVWRRTRSALLRVQVGIKRQADRHCCEAPHYTEGQRFWLSTWDIPLKVDDPKLNPRFIGPYTVAKVINQSAVRRVKPFVAEPPDCSPKQPPPPRLVDGSEAFTVRRLLDVRLRSRAVQYLVNWEGCSPEERCWVSARDILDLALITSFRRRRQALPRRNARRHS